VNAQAHLNSQKPTTKNSKILECIYWLFTGCIALGVGYGIATNTTMVIGVLTFMLAILIIRKKMLWGIFAVLLLPLIGELYRLPFGGDSGTLVSDVAIAGLMAVWIYEKIRLRKKLPKNTLNKPLAIFTGVAIFSLLLSLSFLKISEAAASSLYLARFIEYVLLAIVTADIIKNESSPKNQEKTKQQILNIITISAILIAIAGFIQLVIYPDLGKLQEYGWDPHQNRLVSTWLDPNFIGGFLAYIIALLTGITLYSKSLIKKIGLILIISILGIALFLTYSRSGYLAAVTALGVIGILKSRKLLIGGIIIFAVALNFLPRAQERVDDLVHSAESFILNTNENPDPTAKLRIVSWNQTLQLIEKRPLLGSGYNTLKYVKYNEGFVENSDIHSASGSDSSLLTILATTGILGFIPFVMLYWNVLSVSWKNWHVKKSSSKVEAKWQGYALGILAGTSGLLVHSLFVNSLLFAQIMIFFWISVGMLQRTSND